MLCGGEEQAASLRGPAVEQHTEGSFLLQKETKMMNTFRLCGDLSHVLAIFILLAKIWKTKSAAGKRSASVIAARLPRSTVARPLPATQHGGKRETTR